MDSEPATSSRRRTYAEWYVWSRRNLTNNTEICHAAAQAATEASLAGSDPATAARAAGQSRSGAGWSTPGVPAVRGYAEWYDWSRTNLQLTGETLHQAAAAAIGAIESGGDAGSASAAARASVPGAEAQAPPSGWDQAAGTAIPPPSPTTLAVPPPPLPPPPLAPLPPPPPSAASMGAPTPPFHPSYASGPAGPGGKVILPVWVAVVVGVACGLAIPIEVAFIAVIFIQSDQQALLGGAAFSVVFGLILVTSVLALVGIIRRSGWARAMTIVAGAALCLSCAGILLGLPVIIGAATARERS